MASHGNRGIHSAESGYSMVEVLVAGGLVAVVSLGLSQLMFDSGKAARGIAMTNEFDGLGSNIQTALTIRQNCMGFITTQVTAATGAPNLTPTSAYPIALNEVSYPMAGGGINVLVRRSAVDGGLTIRRIELAGVQTNLGVLPDGNQAFVVNLEIEAERLAGATNQKTVGTERLIKSIPITVVSVPVVDPDPTDANLPGRIVGCYKDPQVVDICRAIGGVPNRNGVACDLSAKICTSLGGVYTAGNVPPCDYSGPGVPPNPPLNITERVCLELGGVYMGVGAVPACTFGQNAFFGATSILASCAALGGALVAGPGGAGTPQLCNFCAAHGGEWNPALGNPAGSGGCDFARKPCEGRSTGGQAAIFTPGNPSTCDSTAADCDRLGGRMLGAPARCVIPVRRNACRGPFTVGTTTPSVGMGTPAYGWGCTNDEYIGDIWAQASRRENNALDGFAIHYMCCQNNLWP